MRAVDDAREGRGRLLLLAGEAGMGKSRLASEIAGEMLDSEARSQYRARLAEIREDMDDAEAAGHADHVDALREERDFITAELSRALGLGGRSRVAGSIAERARLNVTRAVRSSMRRIASADPGLAAHLEAAVRTGTVCVYTPDPRSPISWHVATDPVHNA